MHELPARIDDLDAHGLLSLVYIRYLIGRCEFSSPDTTNHLQPMIPRLHTQPVDVPMLWP